LVLEVEKEKMVRFGPQLWWGITQLYFEIQKKKSGNLTYRWPYHEDIANAGDAVTSGFIPLPKHVELLFMEKQIRFFRD
jgi:hypothetical protein